MVGFRRYRLTTNYMEGSSIPLCFFLGRHGWWYPSWAEHPILQALWHAAGALALAVAKAWGRQGLRSFALGRAWAFWHD